MKIKVRKAKKNDSKKIITLIKELAKFEKLAPPDRDACRRIIRNAFSKNPKFSILLAETEKEIIGYAFYFFTFSTFEGRSTLYLEDIFILENYRGTGAGKKLFLELLKTAKKKNCARMEWVVLDWNVKAIRFYKKLGAKELNNWKYFRLKID